MASYARDIGHHETHHVELNGSLYLLFAARVDSEQRIYIAPMSNPWTLSGNRVLLSAPTYSWEKETRSINQGPVALQLKDP